MYNAQQMDKTQPDHLPSLTVKMSYRHKSLMHRQVLRLSWPPRASSEPLLQSGAPVLFSFHPSTDSKSY